MDCSPPVAPFIRQPNVAADDPEVGKIGLIVVVLALFSTIRCYNADLAASLGGLPIVGPMIDPPAVAPAYVKTIGTPAAQALPEADFTAWFPADPATDPYNPALWTVIDAHMFAAGTQAGWAEVCKKLAGAAGADRAANPQLGALACSDNGTVTQLQRFAVGVLAARASVALWLTGAPGGTIGAIQGRQGELRVLCTSSVVSRQGPANGPWQQACTKALDAAYLTNDGAATFAALGAAYTLAAAELARLDPTIDQEPGYFGAPAKK